MVKILNGVLMVIIAVMLIFGNTKEVNCEYCGEVFNREHTQLMEMCDICFGWVEHKASLTENGIQINFKNGEGYYFEGKSK